VNKLNSNITTAIIDRFNLMNNIRIIQSLLDYNQELCVVLKANAYGHGIEYISPIIEELGIKWLQVDDIKSANICRDSGYNSRLLIWGNCHIHDMQLLKDLDVDLVLETVDQVNSLNYYLNSNVFGSFLLKVHLAVDLGDGLNGCDISELAFIISKIMCSPYMIFVGICSKYTIQDGWDDIIVHRQNQLFQQCIDIVNMYCDTIECIHIGQTSSIGRNFFPHNHSLVRIGSGWAGYDTANRIELQNKLMPTFKLSVPILSIKIAEHSRTVGYYPGTNISANTKYAVLAIGYSSGIPDWFWSQCGVFINDQYCKFIGRPCMTSSIALLSELPDKNAREAVISGKELIDRTTNDIGFPYDFWSRINYHIPRVVNIQN